MSADLQCIRATPLSDQPDNASEFAFIAAGGVLLHSMGLEDCANGDIDGLSVRWRWDAYDLGIDGEDGEFVCWNRCWADFEAPCTAEGWKAWRASVKPPSPEVNDD